MNDKRDPAEPVEGESEAAKLAPMSTRLVPRPSEVHPLNAVTGTPPPVDVNDEFENEHLDVTDLERHRAELQTTERPSTEPDAHSSAPPGRTSLVPPSRLSTKLHASASPSSSARNTRRSTRPSSTRPSSVESSPPELEIIPAPLSAEGPLPTQPSSSRAPRPSFVPTRSDAPGSKLTPGSLIPPGAQTPSASLRPSLPARPHTSIPPGSLKAKGLRPTSLPPLLDKVAMVNEEPISCEANETLQTNQLRDVIMRRAESTLSHANTLTDPAKKSRSLTLASELYAMMGLPQTARLLAERAAKLGNHLGHRQSRQLAHATSDDKAASASFASEIASAPNAEVRRHVATTGTHFERWVRKDALSATRNSELLQRLAPQDPGPQLLKLARQLGQSTAAPQNLTWHPESHRKLSSANVSIQKLRGDAQRITDDCKDPVATFLEVRAALERRDRVAAAKGLLNLRTQPGYERAVVWLAATLLSPVAATRDKSIELFKELHEQNSTKAVRRILAARAVEAGNRELVDSVVNTDINLDAADRAFTRAEQLSLIALGLRPPDLEELAKDANDEATKPLFRALAHANNAAHLLTHNEPARPDDGSSPVAAPAPPLTGPDAVVERLREFDAAYKRADANAIALTLLALEGTESPEHLGFVASTLTAANETLTTESEQWLTSALQSAVCGEAALHTLLANTPREKAPHLLELLAQTAATSEHKALLLAHSALVSTDRAEQVRLSTAAYAADPAHPLVEAVTQRYAAPTIALRANGERPDTQAKAGPSDPPSSRSPLSNQLVSISNAQSVSGRSAYERALALVRQGLRSPPGNSRETLLAHARELLPDDVTLLDLVETTSTQSPAARARARELLLGHVQGAESQSVLRTEAALLYELSGQFSDAARVSQHETSADDPWQWCFQRNAPGTEFATTLRKRVTERATSAVNQAERASGWIHAARLAADAGDAAAERSALDNTIRLDPNHLEGLLAAETLAFKEGEAERIAEVETLLAEAFPAPDSLAHARFAVRFLQAHGGSSSGYTLLLECAEGGRPSLDVARRLLYLAPRMGDDEVAYNMVQQLTDAATNKQDKAILWLHTANLALKLGRTNLALSHVEQALNENGDYIPALSLRAQVMASQELHAQAAEAYERLAASAASAALGGQAYKRAVEHLLKETSAVVLEPANDSPKGNLLLPSTDESLSGVDLPRLRVNLERALALLPTDTWLFELLVQTYVAQKQQEPLTELFSKHLVGASPGQRSALALRFGQACHAMGADERALQLVNEVLTTHPDDEQALTLLARLAHSDAEREKTLLQLVRVSSSPAQQAVAYKQLGNFYRTQAPQALRAAKSFQEVLKRDPTDSEAVRALVELQIGNGDFSGAEQTLVTYFERAKSPTAHRLVAVLRAVIVGAQDPRAGARLLEEHLAAHPIDEAALGELAALYVRTGQAEELASLVKRTRDFAIQQIPVGDQLIDSLTCVASLAQVTGETSGLALVKATFNLYHGVDTGLDARGSRALSKSLDDVLAPPPLHPSVRSFLAQTADLWSSVFKPAEDAKITDKRIRAAFEMKARAANIGAPELYTSEKDPYSCVVLHNPVRIVLGAMWVRDAPQGVLDFLAWRCLKVIQSGIGTLVHLTNHEALVHLDALLRRYIDTQDVLVPRAEQRDSDVLRADRQSWPKGDAALEVLATQVLEHLVQSELELGDALRLWVNRSALLATGEPRTGLSCVALSHGELNTTTGDAIAFAARNTEARHLLRSLLDEGVATAHRLIH